MGFDFRKHVPKQFNKIKVPENYSWEVHNLDAYEELKKEVVLGKKTLADLQEFEHKYRESAEQREWRWRREHVLQELNQDNMKNFREFKDNPKSFVKKMMDMGRAISRWWWKVPNKSVGSGKMIQNQLTGSWHQEYKPNKSMKMKDWLNAAERGNVMLHMNPNKMPLNREPTDTEKGISEEAKKERGRKVWEWVLKETNNFGRGWTDPKYGGLDKSRPGKGGRGRGRETINVRTK
jgi:hypothetical protein